jgi:hypothetical protein
MKTLRIPAIAVACLFAGAGLVSAQTAAGRGGVSTFSSYSAEIQSDGNLPGILELLDSQLPVPGPVQITFIRNGRIVSKAKADKDGVFQAQGLVPGTYSVVATANNRFAAFSVEVLQHQLGQGTETQQIGFAKAPPIKFTVPLTSASDFQLISQVVQQETPPEEVPTPPSDTPPVGAPFGGGGGGGGGVGAGGGGGGLAVAMLATAGAVGLGIGLSNDRNPLASPSTP